MDRDNCGRSKECVDIMTRLYARKTINGKGFPAIETVFGIFDRVASALAVNKKHKMCLFGGLKFGDFAFSTPIMMNATTHKPFHSAACFILPVHDSLESIMETAATMVKIYSKAGGVGIDLTPLRPHGTKVNGTGGQAGGPVSFLHLFQGVGKSIFAGGRARKAAFLGALDIVHPDIRRFIEAKDTDDGLNEMNLSVRMTGYDFDRPVYKEIVRRAWRCGDPGLIFVDNQDNSMPPELLAERGTCGNNPCAEFCFPTGEGAACNLGSINLNNFVKNDTGVPSFDIKRFLDAVDTVFTALDHVIDRSVYPTEGITRTMQKHRPVGLGVTGFARMLLKMGLRYGSESSIVLLEKILSAMKDRLGEYTRNVVKTSIAPTGTLSWVCGVEGSYGIEPLFAIESTKKMQDPVTGKWSEVRIPIPEAEGANPDILVTANELSYEDHIKVVAAAQKYVDMSISKTVNLPNSATIEDVDKIFRLAHASGLKGITVYRDGCKNNQVMTTGGIQEKDVAPISAPTTKVKIPPYSDGCVHRMKIGGRALYVHIYKDEGKISQVFVTYDKPGEHIAAFCSALGRVISIAFQNGVDREAIADTLQNIFSANGTGFYKFEGTEKPVSVVSVPDAIGKVIAHHNGGRGPEDGGPTPLRCESCRGPAIRISGCPTCTKCGWSKCG